MMRLLKRIFPNRLIKYIAGIKILIYDNQYHWKGIYQNFDDVPLKGSGYFGRSEEKLTNETKRYTKYLIDSLKAEEQLPYVLSEENTFLPLICSTLIPDGKLNVLELGGGMGVGFISIRACLGNDIDLNYHIVETPACCKGGRELFDGDDSIKFYSDFPNDLAEVDVVFVKSALQYFKDYKETIKRLISYNPKYVLFIKLAAGENRTYVSSQQNISGAITPFTFLNVAEVISIMSTLRYSLAFKGVLDRPYNQDNFEPAYRVKKNCNLLFKRND